VVAHVPGAPAPFPTLQHLPRDYADVSICTLLVPAEEAARLAAHAEAAPAHGREGKGGGWRCIVGLPERSRAVLVRRAVPLLRAMLRGLREEDGGDGAPRGPTGAVKAWGEAMGGTDAAAAAALPGPMVGDPVGAARRDARGGGSVRAEITYVLRLLGAAGGPPRAPRGRGLRVLSLDGGGIRGLVLVELLRKVRLGGGEGGRW